MRRGRQAARIEHVGSAHTDAELALLLAAARERLSPGQYVLDLGTCRWSRRGGRGRGLDRRTRVDFAAGNRRATRARARMGTGQTSLRLQHSPISGTQPHGRGDKSCRPRATLCEWTGQGLRHVPYFFRVDPGSPRAARIRFASRCVRSALLIVQRRAAIATPPRITVGQLITRSVSCMRLLCGWISNRC
jgi:hypothetical protein